MQPFHSQTRAGETSMSSTPSPAGNGWRAADAAGARKRPAGPRWHGAEEGPILPVRRRFRWGRIFFYTALFVGLTSLFVWASLWLRPARDTSVLLVGASYQDNL